MYRSVDLRETAVKYYLNGHTYRETAEAFGVGDSTVFLWVKKYLQTGDLSNKPLNRSFKKIDPEKLRDYVKEHPDDTQEEIAHEFGCSNQGISKALKRLNITRKKKRFIIKNRILKK